jgi:hypothetical protein
VKVGLGGSGEAYVLVLSGDDGAALAERRPRVERDLRTIPGLGNIASTAPAWCGPSWCCGPTRPCRRCRRDHRRHGRHAAHRHHRRLRQWPAQAQPGAAPGAHRGEAASDARQDLALLGQLTVPGNKGPVMLGQHGHAGLESGPAQIDRYDRQRNINFDIELNGQPLGDVANWCKSCPAWQQPACRRAQVTLGDAEVMGELFASFGLAMLTGVLCIYIVLVLLFKGFMHPVTILAALPLALGGAFVALLAADRAFSMPSLIGLIMLMGMATKNSILLVDYAIIARREPCRGRPT